MKAVVPERLSQSEVTRTLARFQGAIKAIVSAPKPCIACVEGAAVGFGADLALACDLRVFGTGAYLQEKFVDIGLMPDGGASFWLPRFVGMGRALELLMLGTRIDAETALRLGLANRVAPDTEVAEACQALANELGQKAPLALAAIKHAARQGLHGAFDDALEREARGQAQLLESADFREGVAAWSQRRAPKFQGR